MLQELVYKQHKTCWAKNKFCINIFVLIFDIWVDLKTSWAENKFCIKNFVLIFKICFKKLWKNQDFSLLNDLSRKTKTGLFKPVEVDEEEVSVGRNVPENFFRTTFACWKMSHQLSKMVSLSIERSTKMFSLVVLVIR